tara:strand:+ start:9873 stop:10004 length:132 start_codon:yes stop_codon:yes gene_type:complete
MDLSSKPQDMASSKAVQDLDTAINYLRQEIEALKKRIKALEDA